MQEKGAGPSRKQVGVLVEENSKQKQKLTVRE